MHIATLLLIIVTAGLASQWIAWLLRVPAIVILITTGLVLGPITGVIDLSLPTGHVNELIGLGVAIILFEGGMDLKLGELRRAGHGILRMVTLGPLFAWVLGTLAAFYIAGLPWAVAVVMGAILVVTGPTVIQPLLRQARLNKESASLLKWESIVNDPIGVLLAVLALQYFTTSAEGWTATLPGLAKAVGIAGLLGGLGGWLTGWFYRRGAVPAHLKPPILTVLVLAGFWISNLVLDQAGLLTVVIMGLVLGNMQLVEREPLRHFKENLSVVLVSVLFIVIPAQLDVAHLQAMGLPAVLFVASILFVVRPLSIGLATIRAPMRWQDRVLLAWIAPRGIVAAATSALFGPALVAAGHPEAEAFMPLIFMVILVTVVFHGATLSPLARRLGLAAEEANGLLIVGATEWNRALARALNELGVKVMIAEGAWKRIKHARMDGVDVYYGELLSEHADQELEIEHLSYLLCATDNYYYNALVCKALGAQFGHHRTFQLAPNSESKNKRRRLTLQQRGYFAFEPPTDASTLDRLIKDGWVIKTTRLSQNFDLESMEEKLGKAGTDWLLIGRVSPEGKFRLYSREHSFTPQAGWLLLYFAPGPEKRRAGTGSNSKATDSDG
ncbi:MAG TPA: sodium:proton antiporter [Wenzhouxiangella sp.]|nr:sodium:proton antiporter [Wenzhouxiangella sp.]